MITEIKGCRLCGSKNLEPIFDFGDVPLGNDYVKIGENRKSFESPLVVVRCLDCFCVQLKHTVSPDILFKNYLYSTPPNLDNHFKEYAKTVTSHLKLKKGEAVVEIGGNNGILCSHLKQLGYDAVNVEPCLQMVNVARAKGVKTFHGFFDEKVAKRIRGADTGLVKLIVSNNTLAHCDLNVIMKGVKELLDKDGTLIMQNAYLPRSIEAKDVFQVYSEHLFYHLITPLKTYFKKYDLNLYKVEYNKVHLGSFRAYIGKKRDDQSVIDALEQERKFTNSSAPFVEFWNEMNVLKNKLNILLNDLPEVSIYGVPARLALLLRFTGFDKFKYAVEDSEFKIGRQVPGTSIEIKPSSHLLKNPTKYCLIGAYDYCNEIIQKNAAYRGIWINPLTLQLY